MNSSKYFKPRVASCGAVPLQQQAGQHVTTAASLFTTTPVIVHTDEVHTLLTQHLSSSFKVRESSTCVAHYIFPTLGSVAFLVYDLAEVATNLMRFDRALKRITQLKDTFRNAYVCVVMNHSNSAEARTFMKLQFRFASKPGFIPCRSVGDCHESMLALCQAHKKEIIAQKLDRFKQMEAQTISPEAAIDVLLTIPGMKLQDCLTLQQALGGLSNIAQASVDDILRFTSLGRQKANALSDFFVEDTSLLV